jgi:hypothetical protein
LTALTPEGTALKADATVPSAMVIDGLQEIRPSHDDFREEIMGFHGQRWGSLLGICDGGY